jgi:hypothetical protein
MKCLFLQDLGHMQQWMAELMNVAWIILTDWLCMKPPTHASLLIIAATK